VPKGARKDLQRRPSFALLNAKSAFILVVVDKFNLVPVYLLAVVSMIELLFLPKGVDRITTATKSRDDKDGVDKDEDVKNNPDFPLSVLSLLL